MLFCVMCIVLCCVALYSTILYYIVLPCIVAHSQLVQTHVQLLIIITIIINT